MPALLGHDPVVVERAALLAKADLLTQMVGEFPELQGRMGFHYATQDGEPAAVAIAIEEQYLPRHAGDRLPATAAGRALAIADRADVLAGVFALGKRPSGNKDPFGLRRAALGLLRILVEDGVDLDLAALLSRAIALQPWQRQGSGRPRDRVVRLHHRARPAPGTWRGSRRACPLAPSPPRPSRPCA